MGIPAPAKNFLDYEPVLWRVLSKLARDGYVIQPHDARDLIHDFFLEWAPLNSRFDAGKGEFGPYLATSFYRFGRRRQLKLHRLRSRAVDIEECIELASADPLPLESVEMQQQTAQLHTVLGQMPAAEQALLADFLSDQAPGERELAEKHHLTRYRLREQLAASVSRVALQMMEAGPKSGDADVAYRIWVMGQSPRTVAAQFGISTEQVNQAKTRFAQALLSSIRGTEQPVRQGKIIMMNLEILKNALTAFDNSSALDCLRAHAPQVRATLEQQDIVLDDAISQALDQHPEWLASVYAALAGPDALKPGASDDQRAIAEILANEDIAIAEAWAALLDKLDGATAWEQPLQEVGTPDPAFIEYLRQQRLVQGCGLAEERLLRYGLTPAMLFEALHLMELLFDRSLRRAGSESAPLRSKDEGIILQDGRKTASVGTLALHRQLAGTLDLQPGMAAPLARSLSCMLQWSPLLIDGYRHVAPGRFTKLPASARQPGFLQSEQLVRRWCASDCDLP
ncbi:RNA polymerase sigma factor [Pseudoduganella violaceinigra]|uniref:RNA polymerase sigma factor n=1 Tax=Pseudoduganella violaceinigra TaxID=246602 RepID=UPI0004199550|nr:sigma factor [Pseudoduganella violaceinigra]